VEQGRQQFQADGVELSGPAQVGPGLRNGSSVWLIETRAPVTLLLNQVKGEPGSANKQTQRPVVPDRARRRETAEQVRRFHDAIRQKRRVTLAYRSARGLRNYSVIPLDVKGGRTGRTKQNRYMWAYAETAGRPLAFRLERVVKVEVLPDAGFEPAELAKAWPGKQVKWNLPRDWA
jgi:predicted DNA-binding transcriptional regulator YafY